MSVEATELLKQLKSEVEREKPVLHERIPRAVSEKVQLAPSETAVLILSQYIAQLRARAEEIRSSIKIALHGIGI